MNNPSSAKKETKQLPKASSTYPHLKEAALEAMTLPDKDRIQRCKKLGWIAYPRAKELLAKLEDLMESPRSFRPPSMLIVGDSNNGKTAIARRFLEKHPEKVTPGADVKDIPVVYIECPEKPEEKRLYDLLISAVGGVIPATSSISAVQRSLCTTFVSIGVKLIIIDEIHNVLVGSPAQQRAFLTLLKGISNRTETPIVCIGIQTALRMMSTDDQISNRFEAVALPRWGSSEEYMRLLASFECLLPLKHASGLTQPDLAQEILVQSNGLIGEMLKLLAAVGGEAIKNKSEKITVDLIQSINWRIGTERKHMPE